MMVVKMTSWRKCLLHVVMLMSLTLWGGGGDFNIIRGIQEKNKRHGNLKFAAKFNDVIHSLGLREVDMGGGK